MLRIARKDIRGEAKSSLKEVVGDVLNEDILPENVIYHLKKKKSIQKIFVWEINSIIESLERMKEKNEFDVETDIHLSMLPKRLSYIDAEAEEIMERGLALLLVGNDFMGRENDKLIDFFQLYKSVEVINEPAKPARAETGE